MLCVMIDAQKIACAGIMIGGSGGARTTERTGLPFVQEIIETTTGFSNSMNIRGASTTALRSILVFSLSCFVNDRQSFADDDGSCGQHHTTNDAQLNTGFGGRRFCILRLRLMALEINHDDRLKGWELWYASCISSKQGEGPVRIDARALV